jgi:hypothetical protein
MYWDSDLTEFYKNFIVILNWLTFVNPQDDLMLVWTEEFEEYLNDINAMAISKPAEYYKMRSAVLAEVKRKLLKMYIPYIIPY